MESCLTNDQYGYIRAAGSVLPKNASGQIRMGYPHHQDWMGIPCPSGLDGNSPPPPGDRAAEQVLAMLHWMGVPPCHYWMGYPHPQKGHRTRHCSTPPLERTWDQWMEVLWDGDGVLPPPPVVNRQTPLLCLQKVVRTI